MQKNTPEDDISGDFCHIYTKKPENLSSGLYFYFFVILDPTTISRDARAIRSRSEDIS